MFDLAICRPKTHVTIECERCEARGTHGQMLEYIIGGDHYLSCLQCGHRRYFNRRGDWLTPNPILDFEDLIEWEGGARVRQQLRGFWQQASLWGII